MNFPKRFEMENQNPYECPVQIVVMEETGFVTKKYDNLELASVDFDLSSLCGPFANGKDENGRLIVRFECKKTYNIMSN